MKFQYKVFTFFLTGNLEDDENATAYLCDRGEEGWMLIHTAASQIAEPGRFEGETTTKQILTVILEKAVE